MGSDVILIQAVVRRYAAQKKTEAISRKVDMAAAAVIQTKWRSVVLIKQYSHTKQNIVKLQSFIRQVLASFQYSRLKEKKYLMMEKMATKISSTWRRRYNQVAFKSTVETIIILQSLIRRFSATKTLESLEHQRNVEAATRIQSMARGLLAERHFMKLKSRVILIQALVRRRGALHQLHCLYWQHKMMEEIKATKIAAVWKGFRVRSGYIVVVLGMYVDQSS